MRWPAAQSAWPGRRRAEVAWAQPQLRMLSTSVANTNTAAWKTYGAQFETAADALQDIRVAVQVPSRYFLNDLTNFVNPPKASFVCYGPPAHWLMGDAIAVPQGGQRRLR